MKVVAVIAGQSCHYRAFIKYILADYALGLVSKRLSVKSCLWQGLQDCLSLSLISASAPICNPVLSNGVANRPRGHQNDYCSQNEDYAESCDGNKCADKEVQRVKELPTLETS